MCERVMGEWNILERLDYFSFATYLAKKVKKYLSRNPVHEALNGKILLKN